MHALARTFLWLHVFFNSMFATLVLSIVCIMYNKTPTVNYFRLKAHNTQIISSSLDGWICVISDKTCNISPFFIAHIHNIALIYTFNKIILQ